MSRKDINAQYIQPRPRKVQALQKALTAAVDRVAGWDYEPTQGRLRMLQSEVAHRVEDALAGVRAAISFCVPEARKADKTVPADLLKLEQQLHELYRAAWDASHARWPQPAN